MTNLLASLTLLGLLGALLLLGLALLEKGLWHQNLVLSWDAPVWKVSRPACVLLLGAKNCGTVGVLALMHSPLSTR